MGVSYELTDEQHGAFWLDHCGALMDVEPHGEARVVGMCHHIEDPTFDGTALATNPRARIRPIHRPPRVPSDREPHCHWTITIDPENEPIGPAPHTLRVADLPLSSVPNERPADAEPGGKPDYRGPFDPAFRLADLSHGTLVAVGARVPGAGAPAHELGRALAGGSPRSGNGAGDHGQPVGRGGLGRERAACRRARVGWRRGRRTGDGAARCTRRSRLVSSARSTSTPTPDASGSR